MGTVKLAIVYSIIMCLHKRVFNFSMRYFVVVYPLTTLCNESRARQFFFFYYYSNWKLVVFIS